MSERGHKRKRSLQDTPIDLAKIRIALIHLDALKTELDGIEETEEVMDSISNHVLALEDILRGAKKPRVTFSTVKSDDLKRGGVVRKRLVFDPKKVTELGKAPTTTAVEAEITDLHSRLKKIYAHVNMDYAPGSRMILDAVLLALTATASAEQRNVAILPEMRIAQGDRVKITHPVSGYELWLSDNVDYAVIEYENIWDCKDRLLAPSASRDDVFDISNGRFLLVEAKRQSLERTLVSYIPEAVSQAIALLKTANLPEVRFCLSDGQSWLFFLFKSEDGKLTYYESTPRRLCRDVLESSDMPLREIVQLVCE